MLSTGKLLAVAAALYALVGVLPLALGHFDRIPPDAVRSAALSAAFFVVGIALAAWTLPLQPLRQDWLRLPTVLRGYRVLWMLTLLATVYIALAGPTPPFLSAAIEQDPMAAALAREDALKLSANRLFVQVYSQSRDLLAPALFVISVLLMRSRERTLAWPWLLTGIAMAVFIGAWSGQKASLVNYAAAALVCVAADARHMVRLTLRCAPAVAALLVIVFVVTSGEFFAAPGADFWLVLDLIIDGLIYRVFEAPLEVSAAYIDAARTGKLFHPLEVVPGLRVLVAGAGSVENRIGLEYFYTGIDSISANAMAFAYAHVLAGLPGAALGGLLTGLVLTLSCRIVRAGGVVFIAVAYEAVVAYLFFDLLSSNFLDYLLKAFVLACLAWMVACWVRTPIDRSRFMVGV